MITSGLISRANVSENILGHMFLYYAGVVQYLDFITMVIEILDFIFAPLSVLLLTKIGTVTLTF